MTGQVLSQAATTASFAPAPPADASGRSFGLGALGKSHQSWLNFSQVYATIIAFPESYQVPISIASRLFMQVSDVLQGRLKPVQSELNFSTAQSMTNGYRPW